MFATEVDACLSRLTDVIADPQSQVLREEFLLTSQEFGCLGEMLDLPAFTSLCQEIAQALETENCDLHSVTTSALEIWRRSQALVLVGQFQALPDHFEISVPAKLNLPSLTLNDSSSHQLSSQFAEDYEDISSQLSLQSSLQLNSQLLEPQEESSNPTVRVPLRQLAILSDRFGEMNGCATLYSY
jgi:chemosensory pili system protein ChpA (sensor histidine kinase/response regulator)